MLTICPAVQSADFIVPAGTYRDRLIVPDFIMNGMQKNECRRLILSSYFSEKYVTNKPLTN